MKWLRKPQDKVGDRITYQTFAIFPVVVDYQGEKHWAWLEKYEEVRELQRTFKYEAHEAYEWVVVERRGLD
jgi:hypothetical protein